jgi:regulator of cell morphogenesis and NO signaling
MRLEDIVGAVELDMTLGDLVTRHPALVRVLDREGLDYCCGGHRRLDDACAEAGLDAETVLVALRAGGAGPDEPEPWTALGPAQLADHVESEHHGYLWEELPRLTALVTKVRTVHEERHPELSEVAALVADLRADLEPHLMKEERVLFPMIRELTQAERHPVFHCGRIAYPIAAMTSEHDRAGELLARLRAAADDYRVPEDGCASYRVCYEALSQLDADTRLHIHKENNVLFPAVLRIEERFIDGGHG